MSGVFSCSGASRTWRPGGRINSSKGSSSLQPLPSLDPSLTLTLTSSLPRLTSRGPSVTQRPSADSGVTWEMGSLSASKACRGGWDFVLSPEGEMVVS